MVPLLEIKEADSYFDSSRVLTTQGSSKGRVLQTNEEYDFSNNDDVNLLLLNLEAGDYTPEYVKGLLQSVRMTSTTFPLQLGLLNPFIDSDALVQSFQYSKDNKNFYFNYGYVSGKALFILFLFIALTNYVGNFTGMELVA